ncbi:hypothetical protein [Nonomuraea sp. NPDC049758]|uniref:hypothetical protein n=1 Tax=Nonomuraea sp. NPDC049758 TaxID=3154360 RepID=UPI0034420DCC
MAEVHGRGRPRGAAPSRPLGEPARHDGCHDDGGDDGDRARLRTGPARAATS